MSSDSDCLFVITGKSTLIEALGAEGFAHSAEADRALIRDQVAIGGRALPWADPHAFAELMLSWEMRSWHMARDRAGPVFFDRGVPDVVGYRRLMGLPVPAHMDKAARTFRYNRRVFMAPPWPEIFTQDAERKQTFEEAEPTFQAMVEAWAAYSNELVPRCRGRACGSSVSGWRSWPFESG